MEATFPSQRVSIPDSDALEFDADNMSSDEGQLGWGIASSEENVVFEGM